MNINKEASVCRTRRQVLISTASIVSVRGSWHFCPKAFGLPESLRPLRQTGAAMRLEPPKKSLRLAAVILSHRVWLTGLCQKRHFSFTLFRMFTISRATQLRCMPWPDAWRRCLISPLKSASALPSVSMDGPRIPMLSGNRSIVCMPHMPQGNIWPMIRFQDD